MSDAGGGMLALPLLVFALKLSMRQVAPLRLDPGYPVNVVFRGDMANFVAAYLAATDFLVVPPAA
jgi:hypothetical protein